MIARLLEYFVLWRNPVFVRFCRSRLRWKKSIFWYLLTIIVTTFVTALIFILRTNNGTPADLVARGLWVPLLIIQGLILMIKGTGSVSAGLIQDKIDQTLDYQRLTPLTPLRSLLGYLYGLPILEYAMAGLTLPHLLFAVVVGGIPLTALVSVYFLFLLCVTLYHMTGIAVGMVMRRWLWGYVVSIFMVITVNMFLPTFISQFGMKFFQFLSVWPVIGQKVIPLTAAPGALAIATQNVYFSMAAEVPFYNWRLSPFVFTLLMQGSLILTFGLMALRRWQSSTRHSLSKPYALGLVGAFVVLILGNVWPAITGQYSPFAIFGQQSIEDLQQPLAVGLPLVYSYATWTLCLVLFAMVVPSHHAYVRGIRRALKRGRTETRPWEDDSGSIAFMFLYVLVVLAGYWVLVGRISAAGFYDGMADPTLWRLPLALGLVLIYTILLLQVVELKPAMLVILLLWFLPILVAIVLGAAMQAMATPQTVIASLSPIALVAMSGLASLAGSVPTSIDDEFGMVFTGAHTGLAFIVLQVAFLAVRWHGLSRGFRNACGPPTQSAEVILPISSPSGVRKPTT
jgi:hypothetical protein